jgi:outer membrane protein OmpA-like peptidoglycan-associated protein
MVLAACLALLLPAAAHGQDAAGRILDIGFRTLDLETRTLDLLLEDVGVSGETQDLVVAETATEIRIELSADVLFDFDSSDIKDEAAAALEQVAGMIRERPDSPVRIEGHTDSKGSDDYNQALSEERALSVMDWFTDFGGLGAVAFDIVGLGETVPVAPNENADGSDNPEGRQMNRRVEIVIGK